MRKPLQLQIWEELEKRGWVTPLSEPPDSFCEWWAHHDHCPKNVRGAGGWGWTGGITAYKAWQCAVYRDEWAERKHEDAAGTGVNHAYFGWHNPFPRPRPNGLSQVQLEHQKWCKEHNKPDPFALSSNAIPPEVLNARSFTQVKSFLRTMAERMDMNKAIEWTQTDSEAANALNEPF